MPKTIKNQSFSQLEVYDERFIRSCRRDTDWWQWIKLLPSRDLPFNIDYRRVMNQTHYIMVDQLDLPPTSTYILYHVRLKCQSECTIHMRWKQKQNIFRPLDSVHLCGRSYLRIYRIVFNSIITCIFVFSILFYCMCVLLIHLNLFVVGEIAKI